MVYVTPDTAVAVGTTLSPGCKVPATLAGARDAVGHELVARVPKDPERAYDPWC